MNKIVLILGGGRCGKSRHALFLAQQYPGAKGFIATAEPLDDEMKARIENHQLERDDSFITLEEPLNLSRAARSLTPQVNVAVIDCLTVWMGNLIYRHGRADQNTEEIISFLEMLHHPPCDLIIVSNEVGMGIIPDNEMARAFRDLSGWVNRKVAQAAGQVILMVAGIPLYLKKEENT